MAVKMTNKTVALSELKEHPKNPNNHPKEQIEQIAKSIKKFGQYYPIIIDEEFMILAGHGKKKALELLGMTEANVNQYTGLTEKQKMEILLADNKVQQMSFLDHRLEEDLIRAIDDVDIVGYREDYIKDLIMPITSDSIGMEVNKPTAQYASEAQSMNNPPQTEVPANDGSGAPEAPAPVKTDALGQPTEADDDDPMSSFTGKHYITCPHCGAKIEI